MATKHDQSIIDLAATFGGASATDILNRLWMAGVDPNKLKDALAQSTPNGVGTNDATDILTRIINKGIATADQLSAAPGLPVPAIAGSAWPFQPDHKDANGVVIPVHTDPFTKYANKDGTPIAPVAPVGPVVPATKSPAVNTPTPAPKQTIIQNITQAAPDAKKPIDTSTQAGVEEYERQNYGNMLWVNSVPDLKAAIDAAAKAKDSPAAFQARLESTDWWKTHDKDARLWQTVKADPQTYKDAIKKNGDFIRGMAGSMGINLTEDQITNLADQQGMFNWDPKLLQQNVVNMAQYDPKQGGLIGAEVGKIKALSKSYLLPISDTDAFNYAKQIEMGTLDEGSLTGNFRQMAKSSFPSLADIIDKGGIPAQAMAPQINTAAQLLEVDPSTIDLTDQKYNGIMSFADPVNGKIRPMTMDETSQFVKKKDEYWNTANANNDVASLVTSLGKTFGKVS